MASQRGEPAAWVGLDPAGGRLLVAAPMLTEETFTRTVIYLLEHDGAGTAGVVLNRPTHTPVGQVLPGWQDAVEARSEPSVVFSGGPVQPDGALCLGVSTILEKLATDEVQPELLIADGLRPLRGGLCTVDLDGDVETIVAQARELRIFAGHAGWTAGQLEDEVAEGAWFVVEGTAQDVFTTEPGNLWRQVLLRQPPPLRFISTYPRDPVLN